MRALYLLAQTISDPSELNIPKGDTVNNTTIQTGLEIVLAIAGAVTLVIIVVAGLRYTLSQGDPGATAKAKNAIIYALAGLVVIMAAFAIVRFVVGGLA